MKTYKSVFISLCRLKVFHIMEKIFLLQFYHTVFHFTAISNPKSEKKNYQGFLGRDPVDSCVNPPWTTFFGLISVVKIKYVTHAKRTTNVEL